MQATLVDLNGITLGTTTIADADGKPHLIQLDNGSGRVFKLRGGRDVKEYYDEVSVPMVTLEPKT